jgi:hypothetical protein
VVRSSQPLRPGLSISGVLSVLFVFGWAPRVARVRLSFWAWCLQAAATLAWSAEPGAVVRFAEQRAAPYSTIDRARAVYTQPTGASSGFN